MADREFTNINGIKVCDQTARNSIPTKTSQLENDSNFVTGSVVDEKIANAQLGSGGGVDLSGYVTKETGNASQITFSDGQTFQAKLDAGTLKGADGLTTAISVNGSTYTHVNGTITLPDYSGSGSNNANDITIEDAAGNFTATNVEGALSELFQSVSDGKNGLETAITDKGGTVSKAGSIATFQELIDAIYTIIGETVKLNSISLLKDNWKFNLVSPVVDNSYNSTAEAVKEFDDSSWDTISIPHDWSIYNDFNRNSYSGFDGGYLDGGDAWYRRNIDATKLKNQKVYIYFDGVYMETDVYINGTKIGTNKMGYNPFCFDITDYLNFDGNDVLAVFVRNQQISSRWYSGSGIYRNVYLIGTNNIDVAIDGVKITYPNLETQKNGEVTTNIELKINNKNAISNNIQVVNSIFYNSALIASATKDVTLSTEQETVSSTISINRPKLWDEYNGNIYNLKTEILQNGKTIYSTNTKFGYRYFKFDTNTGFWLNGNNIKIRGVCMHHDLGCIGAEANKSAMRRQIRLLKEMGCNAIRTSHNPAAKELLDICAEEGIMVMEEFFDSWKKTKKTYDFARYFETYATQVITQVINRDINNPAIIIWSVGNEIPDTKDSSTNPFDTLTTLKECIQSLDSTRPITLGENYVFDATAATLHPLVDIIGVNYICNQGGTFEPIKTNYSKPTIGTETTSALSSRGIYENDDANHQCSSYDDKYVAWGEPAASGIKGHSSEYVSGMFVWTGFDYIGEPTPFNEYPCKSSYFGIYDTCGFAKDVKYMYQSRWTTSPMIHILPHWDWTKGNNVRVWLYSNCDTVELFLNGVSLGKKDQANIGSKFEFEYMVSHLKGTLVANGYNSNGEVVAQDILYTSTGSATTTKLSSDKVSVNINTDDLVFITCDIVDKNGVIVPTADNQITFTAEGGTVIATDNGNATCVERYRTNIKSAFSGKVLCVVKHDGVSGTMTIKANGGGLTEQSITVIKNNETILSSEAEKVFIDATNPTIYEYEGYIKGYIVTYNLTGCSSSSTTNRIDEGQTYTTTISADGSSVISSIKVLMGNEDITSSVVSGSDITIPNVSGHIQIVAKVTELAATAYELSEPKTFNGTSDYIDTGLKLFDTAKTFTIFVDYTSIASAPNGQRAILHCLHEEPPYRGLCLMKLPDKDAYFIGGEAAGQTPYATDMPTSGKYLISFVNGVINNIVTVDNLGNLIYSATNIGGSNPYVQISENLLLGCYKDTSGTKGRFWAGTINKLVVWFKQLTADEINKIFEVQQ